MTPADFPAHHTQPDGPGRSGPEHDVIVLAGGRGERLGGVDKSAVRVAGRSLLDRVLAATTAARRVVVVGPVEVTGPVLVTREDPPGGGPAAGIAAGFAALPGPRAPWTLVLAVDQPGAAPAVQALLGVLDTVDPEIDAVSPAHPEGYRQWLLAAYRTDRLAAALGGADWHGTSVRRLVSDLTFTEVQVAAEHVGDLDTWEDAAVWERRLAGEDDPLPGEPDRLPGGDGSMP